MSDLYVSSKGACAFKYGMPTATAAFPTEHDMNVEDVLELETCVSVPLPLPDLVTLPSLPTFNTEQVDALAKATKSQSSNPTWKQQRVGRITASMARPVMVMADKFKAGSTVSRSVLDALLGKTSAPSDIPAIKYGNRMEPIARQAYIAAMKSKGHKELTVEETGLVVMKDHIYIGASPDGLVECKCCDPPNGLLEIKCPLSIAHSDPKTNTPKYLLDNDGVLILSHTHGYYSQVQMQMMVTNTTWCDFFVYTHTGYHWERIPADKQHQEQLRKAATVVFENLVLPELKHLTESTTETSGGQHEDTVSPSVDTVAPGTDDSTIHSTVHSAESESTAQDGPPVPPPAALPPESESTAQDGPPVPPPAVLPPESESTAQDGPPAKRRRVTARRQRKAPKVSGPV
ncbi:uncharacterized protein LOC144916267 [Branchiostoma floridae x Branchiostoma belcheri]